MKSWTIDQNAGIIWEILSIRVVRLKDIVLFLSKYNLKFPQTLYLSVITVPLWMKRHKNISSSNVFPSLNEFTEIMLHMSKFVSIF